MESDLMKLQCQQARVVQAALPGPENEYWTPLNSSSSTTRITRKYRNKTKSSVIRRTVDTRLPIQRTFPRVDSRDDESFVCEGFLGQQEDALVCSPVTILKLNIEYDSLKESYRVETWHLGLFRLAALKRTLRLKAQIKERIRVRDWELPQHWLRLSL